MKKILISLMVIGVVAVMRGGSVFSYISDTEISSSNTFSAGVMDLKPIEKATDTGTTTNVLTQTDMEPGTLYTKNMDIDLASGTTITPARVELDIDTSNFKNGDTEWARGGINNLPGYESVILVKSYKYEGVELLGKGHETLSEPDSPVSANAINIQFDRNWSKGVNDGGNNDCITLANLKSKLLYLTNSPGVEGDRGSEDKPSTLVFGLSPALDDNSVQGDALDVSLTVAVLQDTSQASIISD